MTGWARGMRYAMVAAAMLGCGLLAAAAVAAAWPTPAPPAAAPPPAAPQLAVARDPSPGRDAAKLAARSVWGLVPDAPARKGDLRPGLVRGAAVAVADGTLLASCGAVGGREEVGLVRHGKYRRAAVSLADPGRDVCVLRAADAPLSPIASRREPLTLAVGEPVFAITGRPDGGFAVVAGRVSAGPASGADPTLAARLALPPGDLSAVVVDGAGALVGLGAADPAADDGSATVHPAAAALAAAAATEPVARSLVPSEGADDPPRSVQPRPSLRPVPLALTTGRGDRPVLETGERLELTLAAGADAFAHCFYADADGRVSRLFPNRFVPDARVRAGRDLAIPGPEAGFEIVPERPGAAETVACFAAAADPRPGLPPDLAGAEDLTPLPVASLDAVAEAFRAAALSVGGGAEAPAVFGEALLRIEVVSGRRVADGQ